MHSAPPSEGWLSAGGILTAMFGFASATLGAGTLSLPSAMLNCGALIGTFFLVFCGAATVYSLYLLVLVAERTGHTTYEQMARHLIGPAFEKVTAFVVVMFCWGCAVVYVVAIGDFFIPLQAQAWWPVILGGIWGRRLITTIFWGVFMLPLSLLRNVDSLRFSNAISVVSSIFIVFVIAGHSVTNGATMANVPPYKMDFNMMMSLPICIFAFSCQTNVFDIHHAMKPKSVRRLTLTAAISMTICTALYILAGIMGLAEFGWRTEGNILKNYDPSQSYIVVCAFFAIAVTVTLVFPMAIFPTRSSVLQLMHYRDSNSCPTHVLRSVSAALAASALLLGLFAPEIQVLFGLLGGVCGSTLDFIWPAVFILRSKNMSRINVIGAWALIVVGVVSCVLGTASSIYSTFGS